MYYEVKLKTVEDVTLPSAERCSENNFRIISRKSKESSAAEKERERKRRLKFDTVTFSGEQDQASIEMVRATALVLSQNHDNYYNTGNGCLFRWKTNNEQIVSRSGQPVRKEQC